jgi:hypothetical protein
MKFNPIFFYFAQGLPAASTEPSASPSDPWKSVPNPWADPAHQYEGSGWVSPRKIIFFHVFVKARSFSLNNYRAIFWVKNAFSTCITASGSKSHQLLAA